MAECHHNNSEVKDTRMRKCGHVRRLRHCRSCGALFSTIEIEIPRKIIVNPRSYALIKCVVDAILKEQTNGNE